MLLAFLLFVVLMAANLVLYSAFSKVTKSLQFSLLTDILFVRNSWDHTFVELNKIVALTAITLLSVGAASGLASQIAAWLPLGIDAAHLTQEALVAACWCVWLHALYSAYKYYGQQNIPYITEWPQLVAEWKSESAKTRLIAIRKLSNLMGVISSAMLSAWFVGYLSLDTQTSPCTCFFLVLTSLLHFYLMEINYKWILAVRPFGFVGLLAAVTACISIVAVWAGSLFR